MILKDVIQNEIYMKKKLKNANGGSKLSEKTPLTYATNVTQNPVDNDPPELEMTVIPLNKI